MIIDKTHKDWIFLIYDNFLFYLTEEGYSVWINRCGVNSVSLRLRFQYWQSCQFRSKDEVFLAKTTDFLWHYQQSSENGVNYEALMNRL